MSALHDRVAPPSPPVALQVALLLALLLLTPGCLVTRTPRATATGAGDETLLKRANEALLERIAVEQEHVDHYNRQLSQLQAEERRLSTEFVRKEAEYQLLASDRDGQVQEAAEAQRAYQDALNGKVRFESQLQSVRSEAEALEQERAALEVTMAENKIAIEEGRARVAASTTLLGQVSAREARLTEELAEQRRLADARSTELLALQDDLARLMGTLSEGRGARQWLSSGLLATLLASSMGQQGGGVPEHGSVDEGSGSDPVADEDAGSGASGEEQEQRR